MKRFKKPVSILLALLIAFSVCTTALAADYSTLASWAVTEVMSIYNRGVVGEELMSDFDKPITRAEFTSIIVSAYEKITSSQIEAADAGFADISGNRYELYIDKAYAIGVINGKSETVFDPDAFIKREESAKILFTISGALGADDSLTGGSLSYADAASISAWAQPYVYYVTQKGLMQGVTEGFDPSGSLSRQQAMIIIERLVSVYVPNEISGDESQTAVYRALGVGIYKFAGGQNDGDRFKVAVDEFEIAFSRLINPSGGSYDVLTAYNIREEIFFDLIEDCFGGADEDDVSVLFVSSHGVDKETNFGDRISAEPELVLSDGTANDFLSFEKLIRAFDDIAGTKVLIIGACYSGAILDYEIPDDMYILTASTGEEESFGFVIGAVTYNEFEHEFAKAMGYLNRQNGEPRLYADLDKNGIVTFGEVAEYIISAVTLSHPIYHAPGELVLALNPYLTS